MFSIFTLSPSTLLILFRLNPTPTPECPVVVPYIPAALPTPVRGGHQPITRSGRHSTCAIRAATQRMVPEWTPSVATLLTPPVPPLIYG